MRRAIVARLSRGPATLGELAEPFAISLQAVSKHITVLEDAGLVWRTREAQRRPVHLDAAALERLTAWIDRYRLDAEAAYRRLDALLAAASAGIPDQPSHRNRNEGEGIMSNPVVIDATPGQSYADITREFDAPVAAVFRAHADPELFQTGSGPAATQTSITHWDFRTGGGYRFEQTDGDGQHLRVPRRLPHRPRERADHPDVRVRGVARRGEHRHHAVRGAPGRPVADRRPQRVPDASRCSRT